MCLEEMKITDTGLFVSADNTLRHFRNNGIENVSQLVSIVDVNDLELGDRVKEETKMALKSIIELARFKYLGQPMEMTACLDECFKPSESYYDMSLRVRRHFASKYFVNMGFRPNDSTYIFNYIQYRFKDGVRLIDGFEAMYHDVKSNNNCLSRIMELYIHDYHEQNEYVEVCHNDDNVTESSSVYVKKRKFDVNS